KAPQNKAVRCPNWATLLCSTVSCRNSIFWLVPGGFPAARNTFHRVIRIGMLTGLFQALGCRHKADIMPFKSNGGTETFLQCQSDLIRNGAASPCLRVDEH